MKLFSIAFSFCCLFLMMGCDNKMIPLKGTYQDKAYEFTSAGSKDQVWSKLIDLFTAKGLVIKTIDKADGLITTDNTSFLSSYTWENKDGSLINPDAFVVCSKFRGTFTVGTSYKPTIISGQWLVRIKQGADNTVVNLKLANATGKIETIDTDLPGHQNSISSQDLQVQSSGVFEKSVEAALK